jgi:hypothetical protein
MLILIAAIYAVVLIVICFYPATTAFFEGRFLAFIYHTFMGLLGVLAGIYIVGTIPNLFS